MKTFDYKPEIIFIIKYIFIISSSLELKQQKINKNIKSMEISCTFELKPKKKTDFYLNFRKNKK